MTKTAAAALLLLGLSPLAGAYTFPKVKPANLPLYDEALPCAYASRLMYAVSDIIEAARDEGERLTLPEGFPLDAAGLERFRDESIDFRDIDGLPFSQMCAFLTANEELKASKSLIDKEIFETLGEISKGGDRIFLERFNVLDAKQSLVYGVVKDTARKQITVSFRGSQSPLAFSRDWRTNLNTRMAEMKTPKLIADKLDGGLKNHLLVHEGYYNFLFNNKFIDGEQKFDRIVDTIKDVLEDDYSVCITGHSLGGGLASLFSVKLAGMDKEWLPRPITCISYASPRFGASGLRAAHEQLEMDGLLRHLRINNDKDIVPTGLTMSMWSKVTDRQALKHVGMNLRLKDDGFNLLHTSKLEGARRLKNAVRNSIFKPFWEFETYHLMPEHIRRMKAAEGELRGMTIDALYEDDAVVDEDFKAAFVATE